MVRNLYLRVFLTGLLSVNPVAAWGAFGETPPPADTVSITDLVQTYTQTDENGQATEVTVDVATTQVETPEQQAPAQRWFADQQKSASGAEYIALVAPAAEGAPRPTMDLSKFQKIELSPSVWSRMATWLKGSAQNEGVVQRLKRLAGFAVSNKYCLSVVRAAAVGGAAYLGFFYSNMPLAESLLAAGTIGLISGAITFKHELYAQLITQQDGLARLTQTLAARMAQAFGFDYATAKAEISQSMAFDFTFNQFPKLYILQAAILAIVNLEFFFHPLHISLWATLASILIASFVGELGQGTMDTAIATQKKHDLAAASPAAKKRLEVSSMLKFLTVALVTNFATVLLATGDPTVGMIGKDILYGVSLGGLTYWSYLLSKYDPHVRDLVDRVGPRLRSLCDSLLGRKAPPGLETTGSN